jgi:hypothetical protein
MSLARKRKISDEELGDIMVSHAHLAKLLFIRSWIAVVGTLIELRARIAGSVLTPELP